MERNFMTQAGRYLSSRHKKKIGHKILFCLASVVVFSTVYALMLPAITMSNQLLCGQEAHVHTEACWAMAEAQPEPELVCDFMRMSGPVIHEHNEYCRNESGRLICRLPEIREHVHTEACYEQQKDLICQERQEVGHTHTSACYTHVRGELTCTQEGGHTHTEDCYTEKEVRELTCGLEGAEGHTHSEACWQEESREVLVCGQEESEPVVDEETGEILSPGHAHDSSCYQTETESVLVCGQTESGGHVHTDACYTVETLRECTCGLEESSGHVHNDNCYEWTDELVCHEEERPSGHVHTDECYEIKDILVCHEEEVIPHEHGPECYVLKEKESEDEEDEYILVCEKPEVFTHEHDAGCVYVPETVAEEIVPTLICGKEEHEHTEECYMEVVPETEPKYYCGLAEHLHSGECWFDSGELRCNMPEHHHDAQCLIEELWQQSPEDVEPEGILLDDDFTAVTEDGYYEVTFHVTGYASLSAPTEGEDGLDAAPGETDMPSAPGEGEAGLPDLPGGQPDVREEGTDTEGGSAPSQDGAAPAAKPSETRPAVKPSETRPAAKPSTSTPAAKPATPDEKPSAPAAEPEPPAEPEPEAPSVPEPVEPPVQEPEPEAPMVVEPEPAPQKSAEEQLLESGLAPPSPDRNLLRRLRTLLPDGGEGLESDTPDANEDGENVEITLVEEEAELSGEAAAAAPGEEGGDGEPQEVELIPARKLSFEAMLGGRKLDLSQCEITVKVSLAPDLLAALVNRESAVQTLDETEAEGPETETGPDSKPDTILKTTVQDANGIVTYSETTAINETNPGTDNMRMQDGGSLTLAVLDSVYPKYNIEFYAYIQRPVWEENPEIKDFQLWGSTKKEYLDLPIIDTSGKKLPANVMDQTTKYLDMSGGEIVYNTELTQLYMTVKNQIYTPGLGLTVPELDLVNQATGEALQTDHYDRKELWVLAPGRWEGEGEQRTWIAYTTDESLKDQAGYEYVGEESERWTKYTTDLDSLKFTNTDPKNTDTPDDRTIVIEKGTTLRVIYQAKTETNAHQNEAAFYDYDITDGKIYPSDADAKAGTNGANASTQETGTTPYYLNTNLQGINSPANYEGKSGNKFGFGNSNTNSGLSGEEWNGNRINMTNKAVTGDNNTPGTGYGCTFDMVAGIDESTGGLTFKSGIAAPELFGTGTAVGKTAYGDYKLHFNRVGDTYTLSSVSNPSGTTVSSNLTTFQHPQSNYKHIWTNNFWPMDGVASHGGTTVDGKSHDAKFGGDGYSCKFGNGNYDSMPGGDDGKAHNPYFGMQFSLEFNLPETYVGPLEYFFYGDDDMWVFLDNQLVCDIGGVHSSIGEYVDLWDYLRDANGNVDAGNHVLSFYYAERGASGSTCWMQYTLPNIAELPTEVSPPTAENEKLRITKLVEGDADQAPEGPYNFTIRLTGISNAYQVDVYDKEGNKLADRQSAEEIQPDKDFTFSLNHGDYLSILDLPATAHYRVEEVSDGLINCHPRISVVSKGDAPSQDSTGKYDVEGTLGSGANITYTNAFYYELPATGGPGLPWHTLGGGLLLAAGCLWYRKKPEGEGDAN